MGLDISYYATATFVHEGKMTEAEEDAGNLSFLFNLEDFAARSDGLVEGVYELSGEGDGFRAGSYSGYNRWREHLASLVGTTPRAVWDGHHPPAFEELINFADNEGFIGPTTSAKLAKDFAEWSARAKTFAETIDGDNGWFFDRYECWRKAFETAAGHGIVDFH